MERLGDDRDLIISARYLPEELPYEMIRTPGFPHQTLYS